MAIIDKISLQKTVDGATTTTVYDIAADATNVAYDGNTSVKDKIDSLAASTPEGIGFGYAVCDTAEATVDKVAALDGYVLTKNGSVTVAFENAVPAEATLNVSGRGAKPILYQGEAIPADIINAGDLATFIYDGTNYQLTSLDAGTGSGGGLPTTVISYEEFQALSDEEQEAFTGYVSDWPGSGGGGTVAASNILRIIAESNFIGKTVTVKDVNGDTVKTGTIPSNGVLDLTIVDNGALTVECENKKVIAQLGTAFGLYKVYLKNATVYTVVVETSTMYDDPTGSVSYADDAADFERAYMDFTSGEFNYGSWKNAFFMPKPCMVKTSGVVDYYLDPDDYTKKADGTASDVANSSYDGNAMVEVPTVYTYLRTVGSKWYLSISDAKADDSFEAYAHHDNNGDVLGSIFWAIYEGSNVSNHLRSLSGVAPMVNQTAATERSYAQANGSGHDIGTYADWTLRQIISYVMGKSLDGQKTFGYGRCASGNANAINTGTMNTKGLFWGSNDQTSGVKFMGIENPWGNIWKRIVGLYSNNTAVYYKLTYGKEDGSSIVGYPNAYSGTISAGVTMGGTSGGYISAASVKSHCIVAGTASGANGKYLCDGLWFMSNVSGLARVGGRWSSAGPVGPACVNLYAAASYADSSIGAALALRVTPA